MENRIAELRSICCLTQSQLAKKVCCSKNTISSIERGVFNPSLPLAFKIADVFFEEGFHLEYVFCHEYPRSSSLFIEV